MNYHLYRLEYEGKVYFQYAFNSFEAVRQQEELEGRQLYVVRVKKASNADLLEASACLRRHYGRVA